MPTSMPRRDATGRLPPTAPISDRDPLRRLFRALVTDVFLRGLHLSDIALAEYVADMLTRFVHIDRIFRLRDARGRRLSEVAEMLLAADARFAVGPFGQEREIHRHIGDFTLFWTGVYPEALRYFRSPLRKDHLIDYVEQGKRSYYIASTFVGPEIRREAEVLRELSELFDVCMYGLHLVRQQWERLGPDSYEAATGVLLS